MKLEDQVCSLELAKKLKELGVKQESFFYYAIEWCHGRESEINIYSFDIMDDLEDREVFSYDRRYSAFTVAELGEMLPKLINIDKERISLHLEWHISNTYNAELRKEFWTVGYKDNEDYVYVFESEKEADSRAQVLIYIIENKLVEVG